MGLNCKQGDLAVIVRSRAGNEGRVVQCLRLASLAEVRAQDLWWSGPVWVVDKFLAVTFGDPTNLYPDHRMRPLRDDEGEYEMLRIAGRPQERERV